MVMKPDTTAREVWVAIENLFRDNRENHCIQLDYDYRHLTKGDLPISTYCQNMKISPTN